jgi:hypothetical protein
MIARSCFCAVLVILNGVPAYAQNRSDISYSWDVGLAILRQEDPIDGFVPYCGPDSEIAAEGKVGRHFLKWLTTSLFTRVHDGRFANKSTCDVFLPPPPDSGIVISEDYSEVHGYPYVSSGVRLTLSPASDDGVLYRAYGGAEWLWNKSIGAPLYGFGLAFPAKDWLIVAELERRLLKVPYDIVEATYRGSQLITVERTEKRSKEYHWAIRVGVERQFR